jgi:uncharacterized protein
VECGHVGILTVDLHLPEGASLKAKRKEVLRVKSALVKRFACSVAEVDHHDLWQRSRLTVACAAEGHRELQELLDAAERFLVAQDFELVRIEREVVVPGE